MKFLAKAWLIVIFVSLYISLLFSISFKFQILDNNFWKNILTREVYVSMAEGLDLGVSVPVDVMEEVGNRNLENVLNYANAESDKFLVYLPKTGEVELKVLLLDVNYYPLRFTGDAATLGLVLSIIFAGLSLFGLYKLVEPGGKLVAPGAAFLTAGIFTLGASVAARAFVRAATVELSKPGAEPSQIILRTLAPPISKEITQLWIYIALGTILAGVALIFIKKPGSGGRPRK